MSRSQAMNNCTIGASQKGILPLLMLHGSLSPTWRVANKTSGSYRVLLTNQAQPTRIATFIRTSISTISLVVRSFSKHAQRLKSPGKGRDSCPGRCIGLLPVIRHLSVKWVFCLLWAIRRLNGSIACTRHPFVEWVYCLVLGIRLFWGPELHQSQYGRKKWLFYGRLAQIFQISVPRRLFFLRRRRM